MRFCIQIYAYVDVPDPANAQQEAQAHQRAENARQNIKRLLGNPATLGFINSQLNGTPIKKVLVEKSTPSPFETPDDIP